MPSNLLILPNDVSYRYVNVNQDHLIPAPSNLELSEVAAIPEVWLTAYQLLHFIAKVQPGETALVLAAASGVGTSLL